MSEDLEENEKTIQECQSQTDEVLNILELKDRKLTEANSHEAEV